MVKTRSFAKSTFETTKQRRNDVGNRIHKALNSLCSCVASLHYLLLRSDGARWLLNKRFYKTEYDDIMNL